MAPTKKWGSFLIMEFWISPIKKYYENTQLMILGF